MFFKHNPRSLRSVSALIKFVGNEEGGDVFGRTGQLISLIESLRTEWQPRGPTLAWDEKTQLLLIK